MIKNQLNRSSIRSFLPKKIEKTKIDTLKKVINNSPTAKNFQSFSAIFVTDKKTIDQLAVANWNQKHVHNAPLIIVFCADHNRLDMATCAKQHCFEDYIWSTIDATIATTIAMDAAIELGLGTCFIGGLRGQADTIKKALNLQGSIVPVLGLCVGYSNKVFAPRPKINKTYDNKYSLTTVKKEMKSYDTVMSKYYKKTFNKDTNFSKISAASWSKHDVKKLKSILKDQFKINKF